LSGYICLRYRSVHENRAPAIPAFLMPAEIDME
jgi:hypothetical protein